jgi:peptide/nickel transport system substrate-binding protein
MHGLKLNRAVSASTCAGRGARVASREVRGVAALIAVVALWACGAPARPSDVVVYASGTDLEGANPLVTIHSLSRQIQRHALLVTLARYDSVLAPIPYAASRWSWSADRRTLTFSLVPDLRWHDGRPTTAADVAFTLLAAKDPATGYPRATDLAGVDTVVADNDTTASVRFREPQPRFPLILCELPIAPAHLLKDTPRADMRRAAFNLAPVGNGPFRLVERKAGQSWRFIRNDAFPTALGGPPAIAGLVVTVVDEATTKFAGLAAGDLDVAGISPTMAKLAASDPALRVIDYPILFTTGIVFNSHRPPFDDARVRQAIDLAIDRARIVDVALAGYGRAAAGPVPPESRLARPAKPVKDAARADSLLQQAGWTRTGDGVRQRGGVALKFALLTVGSGDNAIEQLIQSDLRERGIEMEIRQVEGGTFLTQARAKEKTFDAIITGVPGDASLAFLAAMFETSQAGGALDYAAFHARVLDTLFVATRRAPSEEARRAAWVGVQESLAASVPVAWIYHSRGVQGVSARLANVVMDLRGEMATVARWTVTGPPGGRRR